MLLWLVGSESAPDMQANAQSMWYGTMISVIYLWTDGWGQQESPSPPLVRVVPFLSEQFILAFLDQASLAHLEHHSGARYALSKVKWADVSY